MWSKDSTIAHMLRLCSQLVFFDQVLREMASPARPGQSTINMLRKVQKLNGFEKKLFMHAQQPEQHLSKHKQHLVQHRPRHLVQPSVQFPQHLQSFSIGDLTEICF